MTSNEIVWQYSGDAQFAFYSGHISGCERLPNGNTLVCEGQSGRVFELTRDGDTCWEWVSPFTLKTSGGIRGSALFRAHRYFRDGPELAGAKFDSSTFDDLNRSWGL